MITKQLPIFVTKISEKAEEIVTMLPPTIKAVEEKQNVQIHADVKLECEAQVGTWQTVQWMKDGQKIAASEKLVADVTPIPNPGVLFDKILGYCANE